MAMTSIRRRLLLGIMGLFAAFWGVSAATILHFARHEVNELFDAQLSQMAAVFTELRPGNRPDAYRGDLLLEREIYGHKYERNVSFQLWSNGVLVVRSHSAPSMPLSTSEGYANRQIGDREWRVFGLFRGEDRIFLGESHYVREELLEEIMSGVLLPLVVALPVLALLVWVAVGKGLFPLQRLAGEVVRRTPDMLQPVDMGQVPAEVSDLVGELNLLLSRLRSALENERRFTADAAHELRTPLAAIRTQAQVAARAQDEEQQKRAIGGVIQGVDRVTHLVAQLLTLARLDPAMEQVWETVDLSRVAEESLAELGYLAIEKGQELELECDPEYERIEIQGFSAGIVVLVRNLVDNAIRYTQPGGRVQIRVTLQTGAVYLSVSDNGPGIGASQRQRVMRRFARLEGSETHDGCGLGLSIVQRIVELHRGELTLKESPFGRGLEVSVSFPCAAGNTGQV
jgi:two-component system sensor histidine kinase QseC